MQERESRELAFGHVARCTADLWRDVIIATRGWNFSFELQKGVKWFAVLSELGWEREVGQRCQGRGKNREKGKRKRGRRNRPVAGLLSNDFRPLNRLGLHLGLSAFRPCCPPALARRIQTNSTGPQSTRKLKELGNETKAEGNELRPAVMVLVWCIVSELD
ncbi:kinase associated protein phosphatase-maize (ISS) [Corchorus olitorius]|uniref:Kinase associated protein phosphatase-maize (ISS) n=1 Tax=Corchorus olitorius TaxID=93759 RepID=A0A1R3G0K8_9ROSI|nr:kinase associated protein phosphatase-maize (ISS) [Corchorus olitorius]